MSVIVRPLKKLREDTSTLNPLFPENIIENQIQSFRELQRIQVCVFHHKPQTNRFAAEGF